MTAETVLSVDAGEFSWSLLMFRLTGVFSFDLDLMSDNSRPVMHVSGNVNILGPTSFHALVWTTLLRSKVTICIVSWRITCIDFTRQKHAYCFMLRPHMATRHDTFVLSAVVVYTAATWLCIISTTLCTCRKDRLFVTLCIGSTCRYRHSTLFIADDVTVRLVTSECGWDLVRTIVHTFMKNERFMHDC